ncbi:MAG: hypothetical protein L3J05_07725, partial [Robiginitomaculum sp.]|nr:hypothetical protein [Robiginitomaculum sp.]
MTTFKTAIIEKPDDVLSRLGSFGLSPDQFIEIANTARKWADDASPLMPANAPGTLAYIHGVNELRQQLLGESWKVDRVCGIEAVINRDLGIRIGYQNVDRACDIHFPPNPKSAKGAAAEMLCGPTLFEFAGVDTGPLTGVLSDGTPTYYAMVGEDGSVELSHPVVQNGSFKHFNE